ncbi:MAG: hypothetical protein QOJ38_1705 [Solirubrobacterales bacterium]|jgi:hypothetical protein|nr:hypothetical protein [Solirubrobacterales bacterium]
MRAKPLSVEDSSLKRHLLLAVIVIAALALAALFIFRQLNPDRYAGCPARGFDRQAWLAHGAIDRGDFTRRTIREQQADQLVRCRTLIGLTRKQVVRMLGRGADGSFADGLETWHWAYDLGEERGINPIFPSFRFELLNIDFDDRHGKNRRVSSAHISTEEVD